MSNETSGQSNSQTTHLGISRDINRPQPFEAHAELHDNEIGEVTKEVLLKWANGLPKVNLPILDVAAGRGIEAAFFESQGFQTIAQDPSDKYLKETFHGNHRKGLAEDLPDEAGSIRGILCKDAFVFISPEQRKKMFEEAKRVLTTSGSILLITEFSTAHRALYIPNNSKYPQTLSSADLNDSYLQFIREIERMKQDNFFFSIQYRTEQGQIIKMAESAGLECVENNFHDIKSSLSQENRWVPRATLVMIFQNR